jgi:hypothetical protein
MMESANTLKIVGNEAICCGENGDIRVIHLETIFFGF